MGATEVEAVDFRGIVESRRGDVGVTWPRKTAMVRLARETESLLEVPK